MSDSSESNRARVRRWTREDAADASRKPGGLQGVLTLLVAILIIVSVAEGIYMVTYVQDQREVQDHLVCQSQTNDQFRAAIVARISSAAAERQAQRIYLNTVTTPGLTREQYASATQEYLKSLDMADQDRSNAPLPASKC